MSKGTVNPGPVAVDNLCCVVGIGEIVNCLLRISPFVVAYEFSERDVESIALPIG